MGRHPFALQQQQHQHAHSDPQQVHCHSISPKIAFENDSIYKLVFVLSVFNVSQAADNLLLPNSAAAFEFQLYPTVNISFLNSVVSSQEDACDYWSRLIHALRRIFILLLPNEAAAFILEESGRIWG